MSTARRYLAGCPAQKIDTLAARGENCSQGSPRTQANVPVAWRVFRGQIVNVFAPNNYGWNTKNHVIHPEWWVNYYTTPQLQLQLHYHYNYNYNHNYNITTSTTSTPLQLQLRTTTALHHTTSRSCEWGDHCNHCNHSKKHNSNHLLVHQWIRSAIHASQQLTSPIAFYPWNFRHRLVRYYW